MKKFGFFLLKNNIHLMTFVFVGWAVWAVCNWNALALMQRLTLGLYVLLIVHEYEEGYKFRFLELMLGRVMGIDHRTLVPGVSHIAQALYITLAFSAALIWPDQLWLTFAVLILGIFEGFVHNMGIFLFQLRGVSPGWWTAMLMCAYSIGAIVVEPKHRLRRYPVAVGRTHIPRLFPRHGSLLSEDGRQHASENQSIRDTLPQRTFSLIHQPTR